MKNDQWFQDARYGLFIHYGLYSLLARGEWVWNREEIPYDEYTALADRFTAERFDADALCDLALRAGMRYVVLTTMHHEGFRLYDTALSDFNSVKSPAGRDLTAEVIAAARQRGLRVGLYHSLNNWHDQPDAAAALESQAAYATFIENTFARIRELVTKYNPIDVLWYDGWWPFNADGWQAERMNAMVREIQPQILFNGRNGLPGDFATPEGHMGAPRPWHPWEACLTLNNSWGFHAGDHDWKTPEQVVALLAAAAQGRGNLLLNVGPRGDGLVPEETVAVLESVGAWLRRGGAEAVFDTDLFTFDLEERGDRRGESRGDWCHHGPFTVKGNNLYLLVRRWQPETLVIGGLQMNVRRVVLLGATEREVAFQQAGTRLVLSGLPANPPDPVCPVLRLECDRAPALYQTGGLRVPNGPHPHYDPCPSDIQQ
ncbi:MAG: alpha-L-fucosidase [Candidatus Marinimicrobia bacterium]|nr:alpha-L-fucosidase [Candidatus Neomarinimicrobiota bacterium]